MPATTPSCNVKVIVFAVVRPTEVTGISLVPSLVKVNADGNGIVIPRSMV